MMRITVNGVRVDASVKKTILPEFWSAAKGKALEKKREYKELNLYLDSIRLRIMKLLLYSYIGRLILRETI